MRVTLVVAELPPGAIALVLRRRLVAPFNVIVLGPNPSAQTLNAALTRLDQSRAYDGDELFFGQTLVVTQPLAADASPYRWQLDGWLEQLRHAAPIAVAEVGNVPAIQIYTAALR